MAQSEDNSGKWWTQPAEPTPPPAPVQPVTPPWWMSGGQQQTPPMMPQYQPPQYQPPPQGSTNYPQPQAPKPVYSGQGTYQPAAPTSPTGGAYGSGYQPTPLWKGQPAYTPPGQPKSPYHWSGGGTYQPAPAAPVTQSNLYPANILKQQQQGQRDLNNWQMQQDPRFAYGTDPRAPYRTPQKPVSYPDWYRSMYGGPPRPSEWTMAPDFARVYPGSPYPSSGQPGLTPPSIVYNKPAPPVANSAQGGYTQYDPYAGYGGGGGGGWSGGGGYDNATRWYLNPSVWRI